MKYDTETIIQIRNYEKRHGIIYANTSGKLYKTLLIIAIISWLYMIAMVFFYIYGSYILNAEQGNLWNNTFITIFSAFVVSLVTPILFAFRLKLTSFFINLITIPFLALSFIHLSSVKDSVSTPGSVISEYDTGLFGLKKIFFWRNGIPMLTVFIVLIWLSIIIIRERITMKNEFETIKNNKYQSQIIKEDE